MFYKMTASNREEITKVLVKYLKDLAAQLNTPGRYPSERLCYHAFICIMSRSSCFSDAVTS